MFRKLVRFALTKSDAGEFSGYASTFGDPPDRQGDVILRGAFISALPKFVSKGFVAWQHQWDDPIAYPIEAREDNRGLFMRAKFHTTELAQRVRDIARERLEAGKGVGLSIGYIVRPGDTHTREDGVRVIQKISELAKVSLTLMPANELAVVVGVKCDGCGAPASACASCGCASDLERIRERNIIRQASIEQLVRQAELGEYEASAMGELSTSERRRYLFLHDWMIPSESRGLAERALEFACKDLRIPRRPQIRWFTEQSADERALERELGPDLGVPLFEGFFAPSRVTGHVSNRARDELRVHAHLRGRQLVETVAHEAKHIADGVVSSEEAAATLYGIRASLDLMPMTLPRLN